MTPKHTLTAAYQAYHHRCTNVPWHPAVLQHSSVPRFLFHR